MQELQLHKLDSMTSMRAQFGEQGHVVHIENSAAVASLSLFGAHLLSFTPLCDGRERLWLSERAIFDGKTPIRGGVPIIWPWFSAHKSIVEAPSHGFVRTQYWQIDSCREVKDQTGNIADSIISLKPTQIGMHKYPEMLDAKLIINISRQCTIELITTFKKSNYEQKSCYFSAALHSYFALENIHDICIRGIDSPYYDKVNDSQNNPCPIPYLIDAEVDRVHAIESKADNERIELYSQSDPNKPVVSIENAGHNGLVVWNPWKEKSISMADMPDLGYLKMLCIEAAVEPAIELMPGQSHVLRQVIK
ncbi:D-hexose-6-phosphate mutarotase [Ningiella sp. W23]|uniref:D-hexose-6-phosphate mutarotase n=1 Tax=Ningiella sp. W23 TaxID=3023715 RepID=UPI003756D065